MFLHGRREPLWGLFNKGPNPGAPPSSPNHFPKAPCPDAILLGVSILRHEVCGAQTQSASEGLRRWLSPFSSLKSLEEKVETKEKSIYLLMSLIYAAPISHSYRPLRQRDSVLGSPPKRTTVSTRPTSHSRSSLGLCTQTRGRRASLLAQDFSFECSSQKLSG